MACSPLPPRVTLLFVTPPFDSTLYEDFIMRKPLIALVGPVLFFCACARVQTFRVIDAETGHPLNGVQAERIGEVSRSSSSANPETLALPVEVASTNVGGVATFTGAGQQFSLRKDGYDPVSLRATLNGVRVRNERTGEEKFAERVEGMSYIALRRTAGLAQNKATTTVPGSPAGVTQASYNAPASQNAPASRNTATSANPVGASLR